MLLLLRTDWRRRSRWCLPQAAVSTLQRGKQAGGHDEALLPTKHALPRTFFPSHSFAKPHVSDAHISWFWCQGGGLKLFRLTSTGFTVYHQRFYAASPFSQQHSNNNSGRLPFSSAHYRSRRYSWVRQVHNSGVSLPYAPPLYHPPLNGRLPHPPRPSPKRARPRGCLLARRAPDVRPFAVCS